VENWIGYSDGDVDTNRTNGPTLQDLIEVRYSRRQALSGLAASAAAFMGAGVLAGCSPDEEQTGNGPDPITLNPGANATTSSGKAVQLMGDAPSTTFTSARWEQTSGPAVALANAGTASASFLAPSVSAPTPLTFRLVATTNAGREVAATTTVTVDVARLDFQAVPKNLNDIVTIPAGYTATIIYRLGDPIRAGVPAYRNDGTDTDFASRAGDHHDALYYYGLSAAGTRDDSSNSRGLLVMNHENITQAYLHPNGPTSTNGVRPEGEALKEMEAHGVGIIEVSRAADGVWSYNQSGALNRRITPLTPMDISGPVRGSAQLRTAFSATARAAAAPSTIAPTATPPGART
jgi:secreted PhoX family phosphatase